MFRNYIVVAIRNLIRQKVYSLINIFGLAIGMALCLLILLYVQDELSFDAFHENAERIYRIARVEDHNGNLTTYMRIGSGTSLRLENDYPDAIEKSTRIFPTGEVWTKFEDKLFKEEKVYVVDETFFDLFTFEFINGIPAEALKEPNSLVLTRAVAQKYFGHTDVIDQMVTIDIPGAPLLKVTGVVEELPGNSHFHPELLVSMTTIRNEQNAQFFDEDLNGNVTWSYLLLKENYPSSQLESRLSEFRDKHLNEAEKNKIQSFYLQALKDIHLRSSTDPFTEIEPENTGNVTYLYIFSIIAALVLVIACINFMNLATARSARRAREVGLRKVVGAEKRQLIRQFIGESVFIAVLSLPVALLLAHLFLPVFNSLSGKDMRIDYFGNPIILVVLVAIVLFVGFLSGSYPAFFLSSFRPINVLKGKLQVSSGGLFRKILVVGQFAVSVGFIVGILLIIRQMNFMRGTDLGFNRENVVVVNCLIPEAPQERMSKMEVLKEEFRNLPGVTEVAMASGAPSDIRGIVRGRTEAMPAEDAKMMVLVQVDYEYLKTLQIELDEGRDFSREYSTDLRSAFIINQAVARELGLDEPVGKQLFLNNQQGTVIGVMKDVHWEPKRRVIFPMVFQVNPQFFSSLLVRIFPENLSGTMAIMEEKWKAGITTRPFQYQFLEDMIDNLYKSEQRLSSVVLYFTVLSLLIACLGLFGLASYTAEQKTKEIGIRKILGASTPGVVFLLSKQFGKLILIANLIAWPLSYYLLRRWLDNFYYRVGMGVDIFLIAAGMILVIAFLSISFQSIRAALGSPADALRYE